MTYVSLAILNFPSIVLLPIIRYMCSTKSTFLFCPFFLSLSGCFKVSVEICHLITIPMATSCEKTDKHRVKTSLQESSRWKNQAVREKKKNLYLNINIFKKRMEK